jgi:hypothetical protein
MEEPADRGAYKGAFGLIEIRLSRLQQLFNSFDPSPFHQKDLDKDAEEYIVGSADEFPLPKPLKLVIELPPDQLPIAEASNLPQAIHNYFAYRVHETVRQLRFQFREGRIALLIGLLFLFACVSVRQIAFAFGPGTVPQIIAEGLLILGWVAMWRPLQIFLYDWWPVRHKRRLYAKLSAIPVEVRRGGTSP